MSLEKLEAEALKLEPTERARLVRKLSESLEQLSEDESAKLWAEEAQRRDEEMDLHPSNNSSADETFQDVRARLR